MRTNTDQHNTYRLNQRSLIGWTSFLFPIFLSTCNAVDNSEQRAAALIVLIFERFQCCFDGRAFRAIAEHAFVQSWVSRKSIVIYSFVILAAATATITMSFLFLSLEFTWWEWNAPQTVRTSMKYEWFAHTCAVWNVWISHNDCLWAVV